MSAYQITLDYAEELIKNFLIEFGNVAENEALGGTITKDGFKGTLPASINKILDPFFR